MGRHISGQKGDVWRGDGCVPPAREPFQAGAGTQESPQVRRAQERSASAGQAAPTLVLALLLAAGQSRSLSAQPAGQSDDWLAPGPAWSQPANPVAPWLARDLCFDQHGQALWAGLYGANPGLLLLGAQAELSASGMSAPLLAQDSPGGASTQPTRVANAGASTWSLRALSATGNGLPLELRRLEVAPGASQLSPSVTELLPAWPEGPFRLAGGAAGLYVARLRPIGQELRLEARDATTGQLRSSVTHSANALRALLVSESGERVLLASATALWLYDENLALIAQRALSSAPSALALAGDGQCLALGDSAGVSVLKPLADVSFEIEAQWPNPSGFLPTALALDHGGQSLAIGFWQYVQGRAVRLEYAQRTALGSIGAANLLYAHQNLSSPLQNFVSAAALSADGAIMAFGLWGQGGSEPELLLFSGTTGANLASYNLPGSVEALALSLDGARVAVGHKNNHANQFGSAGRVALWRCTDLPLGLRQSLRPGQGNQLQVSAPGAEAAWLLVGLPASALNLGSVGNLQLELASLAPPVALSPLAGATAGRFALDISLPAAAGAGPWPLAGQVLSWSSSAGLALGPGLPLVRY